MEKVYPVKEVIHFSDGSIKEVSFTEKEEVSESVENTDTQVEDQVEIEATPEISEVVETTEEVAE